MPFQILMLYPEFFSEKLKFLQCVKVKISVLCPAVIIKDGRIV